MVCTCMQSCSALHRPSSGYVARLRSLDCRRTHGVYSVRLLQQQNLIKVAAEKRETVFGDLVDESAKMQDVPEPGETDFWEGEKWEWLGKLSFVLVPAVVLLAVLVGAFAAKTYDSGATSYLAPPSPDDATVKLLPGKPELKP